MNAFFVHCYYISNTVILFYDNNVLMKKLLFYTKNN